MRNAIKNIIIILFFILAVYQTTTLWFDNFSFYSILSLFNEEKEKSSIENMDYIINRLIVNLGDNRIVGRSNNIYESEEKKIFDNGVVAALNNGENSDMGSFDWKKVLVQRAVIYEYNCALRGVDTPKIFGSTIKRDKAANIVDFDNVIIITDADYTSMNVVFYNSQNNRYSSRVLKNSDIISKIYTASTSFANSDAMSYISSVQSGFDIFNGNVFIPGWQENSMEYFSVDSYGMYKNESMAEKNAEDFFDNPVAKWSSNENNALTYSDENTVVKYDKASNVFEYSNYRVESKDDSDFSSNYIAAVNVIRQDSFINNEIYLDSYDSQGSKYTFRFNYKINDRAVIPSVTLSQKMGMLAFIEVETENGRLVKYKKYAYSYQVSTTERIADCDFVAAIDKVYADEKISNVNLCYIADKSMDIPLSWIINTDNNDYVVSVERE